MAKKMSRGGKRILSLIFHLVVLFVMVNLYDAARGMFKKDVPKPPKEEKTTKATGSSKSGDGTFEKLMAEKQLKAKEKAAQDAKAAEEAKEKKSD